MQKKSEKGYKSQWNINVTEEYYIKSEIKSNICKKEVIKTVEMTINHLKDVAKGCQGLPEELLHGMVPEKLCQEWGVVKIYLFMNSMTLVIPLHSLYWSIHTKDESKRGTAFAFIFSVN